MSQLKLKKFSYHHDTFTLGEKVVVSSGNAGRSALRIPYWIISPSYYRFEFPRDAKPVFWGKVGACCLLPALFVYYGLPIVAAVCATPVLLLAYYQVKPAHRRIIFRNINDLDGADALEIHYHDHEEEKVTAFVQELLPKIEEAAIWRIARIEANKSKRKPPGKSGSTE